MTLNEVVGLLGWRREEVVEAINTGIQLPKSKTNAKLPAIVINRGRDYDVNEADLENFIECFHQEDLGRHPPIAVRRCLLVESRELCGICRNTAPIQFHHIIDFHKIGHYDVNHMIALCPTCHAKCTLGHIDIHRQRAYKLQLQNSMVPSNLPAPARYFLDEAAPVRFSWHELKDLIVNVHQFIKSDSPGPSGRYDLGSIDINTKNQVNKLGAGYFRLISNQHEPYFSDIERYLKDPRNEDFTELYYDIVDELCSKIAASRHHYDYFEEMLIRFVDAFQQQMPDCPRGSQRFLRILISYMYVHCDIGDRYAATH